MRVRPVAALAALLSMGVGPALGQQVQDLSQVGWTVSGTALNRTFPGHLPSQVHLDLLTAGIIGE